MVRRHKQLRKNYKRNNKKTKWRKSDGCDNVMGIL